MKSESIQEVKEAILRESTRLFLANGYRGTSIKAITEAAGVGRGTLYWYFKSKDEILVTLFRKFEAELLDRLKETLKQVKGDFITRYKFLHKFTTEFARDNRDLSLAFNTLLNEMTGTHTEAEKVAKTVYNKFRKIIESLLEEGKRDGSIRKDLNVALYAHAIMAGHTGMLVQWLVHGESLNVPEFVKTVRDIIIKGVT
jgi:AcrR family transcriptional regulator